MCFDPFALHILPLILLNRSCHPTQSDLCQIQDSQIQLFPLTQVIQLCVVDVKAEVVGMLVESYDFFLREGVHKTEQSALNLLDAAVTFALEHNLDGEQNAVFGQKLFYFKAGAEVGRFVDGAQSGRFVGVEVLSEVLLDDLLQFLLDL